MKNFFLIFAVVFITACNGSSQQEEKHDEFTIRTTQQYRLIEDSSSVQWERYLHQKPTKQTIQLFGATVEADLGEVEMTTSGKAKSHTGTLTFIDNIPAQAVVLFDMESFKLAKERGNGLFDVKTYPDCELAILSFEYLDSIWKSVAELTIQDTMRKIEFFVELIGTDSNYVMQGNFPINTLDFPLRNHVTAADVYKDVITVSFNLHFTADTTMTDTIRKP